MSSKISSLGVKNELFSEGVFGLSQVMRLLESMGISENIIADMKIIRGLDYYTSTVFEFILPEYKEIGSICGGGRYENLAKYFTNKSFPGVGGSIGLTRLFYILNEKNLLKTNVSSLLDYAIIPVSDEEFEYSFQIAAKIRAKNKTVTVILLDKKLRDKMAYSAKIAKNGIVIGESEVKTNKLKVKDFRTEKITDFKI